jgi:hypothetical protein
MSSEVNGLVKSKQTTTKIKQATFELESLSLSPSFVVLVMSLNLSNL